MEFKLATKKDFEQFLPIKEEFLKDYHISRKTKEFIFREFQEYLFKGAVVLAIESKNIIGYLEIIPRP